MTTISLPPEIEGPLAEAARRQGTTPERLAVESLRQLFPALPANGESSGAQTLYEFLAGHIGTVADSTEAYSEQCGQRFAEGLAQKQQRGRS